jgi:plastocyanin
MCSHSQRRRLARVSSVIGAAALLGALCAPAALFAQAPAPEASPTPAGTPTAPAEGAIPETPASPGNDPPGTDDGEASDPEDPVPPGDTSPVEVPPPQPPASLDVAAAGGTTVTMADFSFSPATITVGQGDTVTWTNSGPDEPHTATGDGFDTGEVAVGSSASATFSESGNYPYVCTLHANMTGTVRVLAAAGGGEGGAETAQDAPAPGSEAAAVAAPDAAGTASKLPATGLVALPLALIGFGLLLAGAHLRRRNPNNFG